MQKTCLLKMEFSDLFSLTNRNHSTEITIFAMEPDTFPKDIIGVFCYRAKIK